jgi:hypothetical protein
MISPALIQSQIEQCFEKGKNSIEIDYLKKINKILTEYMIVKNNFFLSGKILLTFELDKKLYNDISNEKIKKEKDMELNYYKSIENVLGILKKVDYSQSFQLEVQKAFFVDGPLSMYRCKIAPVYYK